MEDGLFSWSDFHGLISLKKIQFAKPLGLSLGVNRMCTKKNEHAPKSECANFQKYAQKGQF
jgi:hypothetical protein